MTLQHVSLRSATGFLFDHFAVIENKNLMSKLITTKPLMKGQIIARDQNIWKVSEKATYLTVQCDINQHVELGTDLIYMNHSCSPSAYIDTEKRQVVTTRDLNEGDEITFFYPSTEWKMAQPFTCWCQSENCLKSIQGAFCLNKDQLKSYFINKHILKLMEQEL